MALSSLYHLLLLVYNRRDINSTHYLKNKISFTKQLIAVPCTENNQSCGR
jgi:hypothetical protein